MAVEDHGAGAQFVRFRWWPRCSPGGLSLTLLFAALSAGAGAAGAWLASAVLGAITLLLALRMFLECAGASSVILRALAQHAAGGN
jgi:hypothetical protein